VDACCFRSRGEEDDEAIAWPFDIDVETLDGSGLGDDEALLLLCASFPSAVPFGVVLSSKRGDEGGGDQLRAKETAIVTSLKGNTSYFRKFTKPKQLWESCDWNSGKIYMREFLFSDATRKRSWNSWDVSSAKKRGLRLTDLFTAKTLRITYPRLGDVWLGKRARSIELTLTICL
jgi:hypothetical protein